MNPVELTPRSTSQQVRDQRIEQLVPLRTPQELFDELPLDEARTETLLGGRADAHAILSNEDDRLLVVVATRDYAARLAQAAAERAADLMIAMRVYFEKPRTTIGWKGLINDPHLDGSGDVNAGLRIARQLLLDILGLGLPIGCEFLDPITPQYISDAVSWGAIGARTTESQIHRQLGSGLSMPVGFKNRTDGDVQVAVDAVRAAAVPHAFAGIDVNGRSAILHTRGNQDCHIILRGGRDRPNYGPDSVASAAELLRRSGLAQRLMIDLSHGNSGKQPERQPQVAGGEHAIVGVMLESFIVAGRQDIQPQRKLTYGQSITDGCIDWDTTVRVLDGLAESVRRRRECGSQSSASA